MPSVNKFVNYVPTSHQFQQDSTGQLQQQNNNNFVDLLNFNSLAISSSSVGDQQHPHSFEFLLDKQLNGGGGSKVQNQNQPSSRYKTELCRPFEEHSSCKYGDKCQFAHGQGELRSLSRHPKYKTELCRTFHTMGLCPYGHRCHFIHNSEEEIAIYHQHIQMMQQLKNQQQQILFQQVEHQQTGPGGLPPLLFNSSRSGSSNSSSSNNSSGGSSPNHHQSHHSHQLQTQLQLPSRYPQQQSHQNENNTQNVIGQSGGQSQRLPVFWNLSP